jgi:hypothetical protein
MLESYTDQLGRGPFYYIIPRCAYIRGSVVVQRLVTGWAAFGLEFESRQRQEFSLLHIVQNGSEEQPTSYPLGYRGSSPGGKVAGVSS